MTLAAQKPSLLAAQAKPICTSPEDSARGWSLGWLGLGPGARAPQGCRPLRAGLGAQSRPSCRGLAGYLGSLPAAPRFPPGPPRSQGIDTPGDVAVPQLAPPLERTAGHWTRKRRGEAAGISGESSMGTPRWPRPQG